MVGEHDDLVGPRRVAARALDLAELLVELAQGLERVGSLEAGVVRDLVVARERRIDRGPPAHHVGEDAEHDQVADDHAHRAAQERIDAAAVPRGRTSRRAARSAAVHSSRTSQTNRTSARVTLKPLAKNAR